MEHPKKIELSYEKSRNEGSGGRMMWHAQISDPPSPYVIVSETPEGAVAEARILFYERQRHERFGKGGQ